MRKYFYLEPYVYYERGRNGALLVNLLDDKCLYFSDVESMELLDKLLLSELRTVVVSKEERNLAIIKLCIDNFMGDIVEASTPPLQFQGEINIVRGEDAYRRSVHYSRQNINSYLTKCYIFSDMSHPDCKELVHLITGGTIPNDVLSLDNFNYSLNNLINILADISSINPNIEVFLSGIGSYALKEIHTLFPLLDLHPILSQSTLMNDLEMSNLLKDSGLRYSVIIDLESEDLKSQLKFYDSSSNKVTLLCKIKSLGDEKIIINLIQKGVKIRPFPVLNSDNGDYIFSLLSLNVNDLINLPQKYWTIKINSLLNSNFWGHIYIYPDLTYSYSLLNEVHRDLEDLKMNFEKDFLSGSYSWSRIRNFIQCRDCVFQRLCPSPGYLELHLRDNQKLECLMEI